MTKTRGHHRGHEEHEEHEEHVNHEAWVIPYADMLTLLMALFLVLFAVGRTDLEKFKKLAQSFRQEFGNSSTEVVDMGGSGQDATGDGGAGVLPIEVSPPPTAATTTTLSPADEALGEKQAAEQAAAAEADSLDEVRDGLAAAAAAFGIGDSLNLTLDARGLVVTIVTDQVLFAPGQADLQPAGLEILDVVGQALLNVPNEVAIEGHTDDRPLGGGGRYADNWDLSGARANSVLRHFIVADGLPPERLSANSFADTRPIADNSTPEGQARNRRVEVIVKAQVSLSPVLRPDGTVDEDRVAEGVADAERAASADADQTADGPAPGGAAPPAGDGAASPPAVVDPAVIPDLSPGLKMQADGGAG